MGNQYSISTADQVFPVEHYFNELPYFALGQKCVAWKHTFYEGCTRTARVSWSPKKSSTFSHHTILETFLCLREGPCVVKIYVIHDRSLNLEPFERSLLIQREVLKSSMHCLPFTFITKSDRFAVLGRSFVKDTLYERMNGRPYLLDIEKKWIAFQLLQALRECHEKKICHGDIKTTNIVLTSWTWVYLTDFACFKPTMLPDSDPADFNYYFDTSRKRTCYIAPERFSGGAGENQEMFSSRNSPEQLAETKLGPLHWSMDIFSLGCVFMEFLGDGDVPFDLSNLLAFRSAEFRPTGALSKIESEELRVGNFGEVEHMIQRDYSLRLPAGQYLITLRGKGFPEIFYTFLNQYLYSFTGSNIPDDNIIRLREDLPGILEKLPEGENSTCLVLILSLLLANWRGLHHSDAKLAALDVAESLAPLLPVDVVLDRLLPYLLTCVDDRLPIVRANFIITFCNILQTIPFVRRNEGHIFRAYILPDIEKLVDDSNQRVRITFAMHIAQLAETAMRFLELSYLNPGSSSSQELVYGLTDEDRYPFDVERLLLLRNFQSLLEKLILKQSNSVKRALLEHGMGKLCQVFGRKLTHEMILPHLVTFLNEKPDWQLRAAFFKAIVDLAAFVGLESAGVFRALLEQGLTDPEEFVVFHALRSFLDLVQLHLLPKKATTELLTFCSCLLIHPNLWIRKTAVSLFVTASKNTDYADQQTRIRPMMLAFFEKPISFIDEEEAVLGALLSPLSRRVYNVLTQGRSARSLFQFLDAHADPSLRLSPESKASLKSKTAEFQLYQKLHALGLDEKEKAKVILLKEFLTRLRPPSQSVEKEMSTEASEQSERTKTVNKFGPSVPIRTVPEIPGFDADDAVSSPMNKGRKQALNDYMLRTAMSQDWTVVFGKDNLPHHGDLSSVKTEARARTPSGNSSKDPLLPVPPSAKRVRVPACEVELQRYIKNRHQERGVELSNEVSLTDLEPPPIYHDMLREWRPSGILLAHLHEHSQSIVRLRSNRSTGDILSGSLDGTVKLWDCASMEGRGLSNRAKYTYKNLGSPVRALTYCEEWKSIACAGESGSIHVIRVEADASKSTLKIEKALDPSREGVIVEMAYSDPGILKTFCVSPEQSWITTGSKDGYMVTWDMRFRIPISHLMHPTGASIHRLYTHPKVDCAVIACAKGNNEVSVWNTETSHRTMALWSGTSSPLSIENNASKDTIRGLQILSSSDSRHLTLITSGTDRRTRYWDSANPEQSYLISAANGESSLDKRMFCQNVNVGSVQVTQETREYQSAMRTMSTSTSISASWSKDAEAGHRGFSSDSPSTGHADAVNDLVICSTGNQLFLVTASRDGIIKVWK